MHLSISQQSLEAALSICRSFATERRTTAAALTHVLLDAQKDKLRLMATDLENALIIDCAADVHKPGSCAVPARTFCDYVRRLPEDNVRLRMRGQSHLAVECRKATAVIGALPATEMPQLPSCPEQVAWVPTSTFSTAVRRTAFCALTGGIVQRGLHFVLLEIKAGYMRAVASDGNRLALGEFRDGRIIGDVTELVHRRTLDLLDRVMVASGAAGCSISHDENHLFFSCCDHMLIARKTSETFPNYQRVLPEKHGHQIVVARTEFIEALQRAMIFTDKNRPCVKLTFDDGDLTVASSSDVGVAEEPVTATNGVKLTIAFNGSYILDFLQAIDCEKVKCDFVRPDCAAEFNPVDDREGASYRYIVMPMRV